jgi:hypothetical protein
MASISASESIQRRIDVLKRLSGPFVFFGKFISITIEEFFLPEDLKNSSGELADRIMSKC